MSMRVQTEIVKNASLCAVAACCRCRVLFRKIKVRLRSCLTYDSARAIHRSNGSEQMDAMQLDTLLRSTDSLVSPGDDNVASTAFANEVTETKHNNKNDAAADAAAETLGVAEVSGADKRGLPGTLSISADNDKKKNGSGGNIGDARENYKFDVST